MLPFTTYRIPQDAKNQTPSNGKWLFFFYAESLSDEKKELLTKISSALKATFETDVACLAIDASHHFSFHDIVTTKPSLIVSFGVPAAQLGLWIDLHTPGLRLMQVHTFILTCSLTELEKNPLHKKALWRDMQLYLSSQSNA